MLALENEAMPIAAGFVVYHATGFQNIMSIIKRGVRNVDNAWGGGEVGPGFYTATTALGAAGYLQGVGGILEFVTTRNLTGQGVNPPANWDYQTAGRAMELKRLCWDHNYLFNVNANPILEYKFNNSGMNALSVTAVHLMNGPGWVPMTRQAYVEAVEG